MEKLNSIASLIHSARFSFSSEVELHRGLDHLLTKAGIAFTREVQITQRERIDFMLGGIGLEVKVDGSASEIVRQLHRYAQNDQIKALLLVTTRSRHCSVPDTLNGKPVLVVYLLRSML